MLDELIAVIETLKSRIEAHRAILSANETRTRGSLIDPLLTALGWDTADPSRVTLEYDIHGKRADYGLLAADGSALVFLEAKRLGESLSNHRSQITAYASEVGIRFPALTNGDQWEVFDNSKLVPIAERRILNISVAQDPTPQVALQFLLLWRSSINSGNPQPPTMPILDFSHDTSPQPQSSLPEPAEVSPGKDKWSKLDEFRTADLKGKPAPTAIRFPDGTESPISAWATVLVKVAEYLVRTNTLTKDSCPVIAPDTKPGYCIVNTEPVHPNTEDFSGARDLSNGLYLVGTGRVRQAKRLMDALGQDPAQVWLKTG